MTIPAKIKVAGCFGPFTSEKTGSQFFILRAETAVDSENGWSTIRWSGISSKQFLVGTELPLSVRKLDGDKGEGQFYVR